MNKPTNGCENLELYAIGGLDDEERTEFERHLQECTACAAELVELIALVDLLPMASEPVSIPEGMKARVLDHVLGENAVQAEAAPLQEVILSEKVITNNVDSYEETKDRAVIRRAELTADAYVNGQKRSNPKGSRAKPWLYGGLSAAVLILGVYSFLLQQDNSDLKSQLALMNRPAEAVQVNNVVALSSTAKEIVAKGLATIVIDAKGTHLLVQAEQLPELKNSEAYQVWLIKGKETPVNAGTFMTHNGTGGLYYTFDSNSYDTIAITLEPDAHGDKPRGTPVLAAALLKS
ncbi:anti-sigma factor [Paenibacillus frigoriresistens]|uniref:anti-sigma factor n=1 Tax=Paenibacillus alginolyticus TaxID=59839 RepID=UPI001565BCB5|nr:anti-sigma factor [Paenibacillus frigoriresistens]NRF94687.1 anti-sigma factor [Paenibacillus frigoriresistens]